jgi:hypothetical protein
MPDTMKIDGNDTLSDQESALQFKEGAGNELTALEKGGNDPPVNHATFKRLAPGSRPKRLRLVLAADPQPPNSGLVLSCNIFVEGEAQNVNVYREQ